MIEGIGGIDIAGNRSQRQADTPAKVKDAASQFEALLIGQLLKSMRQGDGGWLGTGDDEAGGMMVEIAEEHLARVLAAQGGLGLASVVTKGLHQAQEASER